MKYRVKLKIGRVVGPFDENQIVELFLKGHIDGSEECQVFPIGDWAALKSYDDLKEALVKAIAENKSPSTSATEDSKTVVNFSISKNKVDNSQNKALESRPNVSEFNYADEEEEYIDYHELEERYEGSEGPEGSKIVHKGDLDAEVPTTLENENEEEDIDSIEKTIVLKRPLSSEINSDRTVVTPESAKYLKQLEEEKKKKDEEEKKKQVKQEEEKESLPIEDEKTQFIDLKDALQEIKISARETELAIEKKEREQNVETDHVAVKEEKEVVEKKKGIRPFLVIIFVLLIGYLLMPSDEEKRAAPITPLWAKISFPVSNEYEDSVRSDELNLEAMEFYNRGTYISKLKAAKKFNLSLRNKFKDNKALGYLVMLYSELLPNAKNKEQASNSLFKLVEIARAKVLTDVNVAIGTARFYAFSQKKYTALKILEDYIRVGQPNVLFLVEYLNLLLDVGKIDEAKIALGKLEAINAPPFEAFIVIARYYSLDEQHDKAKSILIKAAERYSKSVKLLLTYADYLLRKSEFKKFVSVLKAVKALRAERSPVYYSKYLEYMGVLSAYSKDNKSAVILFKKALKLNESQELRSKLASLELGGSKVVEDLILESKVVNLMRKAKIKIHEREWDKAFSLAINASDLMENYVPAKLLLSKIQTERGYYNAAIQSLETLHGEFPLDADINFQLVETYIAARMLERAKKQINKISATDLVSTYYYASMLGRYFDSNKNFMAAFSWMKKSIRMNPLNDRDFYYMAVMLHRRNKLKDANTVIKKAITLDPENIDYRILYAKIVYEFSGSDAAIGYLRDILTKYPSHPKILARIAIFYHMSGQIQLYESNVKKIQSMPKIDSSFYSYLIKAARLDEKYSDVIKYSNAYFKLNPGDLFRRIELGSYLLEKGNLGEAEVAIKEVVTRLPNYPKSNYYLAKIAMYKKEYSKALEFAKLEREYNGAKEFGFSVAGEILRRMEKYPESIKMLEQAIARNGKSLDSLTSLAWIKSRQNYYDESKELYLRVLREEPGNPNIHRSLGYVYKSMGQSKLAIESFKVYLDLSPSATDKARIKQEIKFLR
ncbi:MAG: tetratricopeptide repeat protein [Bacteriovoracaceae bacterium]|nr:tetratricopeptide repeat protein [Bacteriovoracaceae bacterium]